MGREEKVGLWLLLLFDGLVLRFPGNTVWIISAMLSWRNREQQRRTLPGPDQDS